MIPREVVDNHCGNKAGLETKHPYEISLAHIRHIVKFWSAQEDLVIDPFMGSGTTAKACKEIGRKFLGIEREKRFCEMAVERLRQEPLFGKEESHATRRMGTREGERPLSLF